jgi:hypothetical protein
VLTCRQLRPCSSGPAGVQRPSSTAPHECSHTHPSGCVTPAAAAGLLAEAHTLCGECWRQLLLPLAYPDTDCGMDLKALCHLVHLNEFTCCAPRQCACPGCRTALNIPCVHMSRVLPNKRVNGSINRSMVLKNAALPCRAVLCSAARLPCHAVLCCPCALLWCAACLSRCWTCHC